jgi:hypothetical protein
MKQDSLLILEVPSQFDSWTRHAVNALRRAMGSVVPRSVVSVHHPVFYSVETINRAVRGAGFDIAWCRSYFPERWSGPAYRQLLRLMDLIADRVGHHGENIEIAARLEFAKQLGFALESK